ncbi:MAG: stress response translation initiation inhibitor YciH [Nitrospirae bacterium]|nr:stress response translation initiation inhibitor YciH [Nitrospirota bacterium]
MPEEKSKLVYSTDSAVPRKEKSVEIKLKPTLDTSRQSVIVRLDRKGRAGKSVTIIEGLQIPADAREKLLKKLKSGLGTGGTVKDMTIEIQGDHCDAIISALTEMCYKPKRSGG